MKRIFNISRADMLLVAATVVAALRMMLIHAVFIGFDLEAWPWFKAVEVGSGLAFALLEGVALAYVSRLWVSLRPARRTEWVYWIVLALGQLLLLASIIGVTAYAAAGVRREVGIDTLLGSGAAIAWSMFVTALNPLMVVLIGIARAVDPKEQQAADRPTWPPIDVQVDLFIRELGDVVITPDEAARKFAALTNQSIATRIFAHALASRDLKRLSARVDTAQVGVGVQDDAQQAQANKALTIRSERTGASEQGQAGKGDQADRRARVREMHKAGASQAEIARALGCNASTVRRDLAALQREAEAEAAQVEHVRGNGKVKERVV